MAGSLYSETQTHTERVYKTHRRKERAMCKRVRLESGEREREGERLMCSNGHGCSKKSMHLRSTAAID